MSLLLKGLLVSALSVPAYAAEGNYCQINDVACKPCQDDRKNCRTVHGKRKNDGSSLGAIAAGQTNRERKLESETFILSDAVPATDSAGETRYVDQEKIVNKDMTAQSRMPMFISGDSELTPRLKGQLDEIAAKLEGREQIRIAVTGHTDSQRLSARSARKYRDNDSLGLARAQNAAEYLSGKLSLNPDQISIASKGESEPAASNSTPEGMAQNRRIEVQAWYAQPETVITKVAVPAPQPAAPAPLRSCEDVLASRTRATPQPFRISVDGVPVDDSGTIDPDIQRCTDVALEKADIQVRYDNLEETPWLNVTAFPIAATRNQPVKFTTYSNYRYWIERSEIRIFPATGSTQAAPLAVLPADNHGQTEWIPDKTAQEEVRYVLRVYDKNGNFDETRPQKLPVAERANPLGDEKPGPHEDLIGYGENRLDLRNIKVQGGAVTANGEHLQPGQRIRFLGQEIPVDKNGKFAARQLLPAGSHVVNVEILDEDETPTLNFARNLYIPDQDWFYIALTDLTGGRRYAGTAHQAPVHQL